MAAGNGGGIVKFKWLATALIGMLVLLSACASEEPIDLNAVEAKLATNPEMVTAGSQVELTATVTGMEISNKAKVTLDARIGEEPVLFDAVNEGDGVFTASFTFPEPGVVAVYIHLYVDDIHLTKKQEVEVR